MSGNNYTPPGESGHDGKFMEERVRAVFGRAEKLTNLLIINKKMVPMGSRQGDVGSTTWFGRGEDYQIVRTDVDMHGDHKPASSTVHLILEEMISEEEGDIKITPITLEEAGSKVIIRVEGNKLELGQIEIIGDIIDHLLSAALEAEEAKKLSLDKKQEELLPWKRPPLAGQSRPPRRIIDV